MQQIAIHRIALAQRRLICLGKDNAYKRGTLHMCSGMFQIQTLVTSWCHAHAAEMKAVAYELTGPLLVMIKLRVDLTEPHRRHKQQTINSQLATTGGRWRLQATKNHESTWQFDSWDIKISKQTAHIMRTADQAHGSRSKAGQITNIEYELVSLACS